MDDIRNLSNIPHRAKIKLVDDILLILNRTNPNQAAGNLKKQKDTEAHIRTLSKFNKYEI
mgnify:CR=1 FL=1